MAVNRCKNLVHLFKRQYLFSSNGIRCLVVGHTIKSPYSMDVKSIEPNVSGGTAINSTASTSEQTSASQTQKEDDEHKAYEENIRLKILQASLPFVHNYGWSKDAITAGAESLGYPGIAHGLFPRGGAELIQHFYVTCNQELVEKLKTLEIKSSSDKDTQSQDQPSTVITTTKKPKDPKVILSYAVETRLRMIEPYLSHWPQALAIMTLPPNVPTSLANLLTLVDDIWYYAGDRSVDFNWYSRRVALAGIYKMTELYMIQDGSADHQATWTFLNNRIDEAAQLHSLFLHSESAAQFAKDLATSTFITARNILGLNWNR